MDLSKKKKRFVKSNNCAIYIFRQPERSSQSQIRARSEQPMAKGPSDSNNPFFQCTNLLEPHTPIQRATPNAIRPPAIRISGGTRGDSTCMLISARERRSGAAAALRRGAHNGELICMQIRRPRRKLGHAPAAGGWGPRDCRRGGHRNPPGDDAGGSPW